MTVNTASPSTEVVRELIQVEHAVCPGCGTVVEDHFSTDLQLEKQRNQKLERELAAARRTISKFERDGVKAGLVEAIFELWANLNNKQKNTKLTPDRRKAITAALKLYGEPDVRKVVAQNAKTPYLVYTAWRTTGNRDSLRDITDFLGKGKHFDALLDLSNATEDPVLTDEQMAEWHSRLFSTEAVINRIEELKGWTATNLETLGVGFDGERLIFPVRDAEQNLVAAIRYFPGERKKDVPKAIAIGPRGLFPSPETIDSPLIWLVEGEPDAVSAHEMWLPAVAVPGAAITQGEWMKRLTGRRVVICFDCDNAGRSAALRIARPLTQYATDVRIVDLDPAKDNGFDLTDWFRQGRSRKTLDELLAKAKPVDRFQAKPLPQQTRSFEPNPASADNRFDRFVRALEDKDCDPKELRGGQWRSRCPAHDDRVPTLYFRRGDDAPVITDCKAGCTWDAVSESLGQPTKGKE